MTRATHDFADDAREPQAPESDPRPGPTRRSTAARIVAIGLPIAIIAAGVFAGGLLLSSPPTAPTAPAPERNARLVTVSLVQAAPATLPFVANGTIQAADSTAVRARVSGQIVELEQRLAPGTRFQAGDVLARIDPSDYELALDSARSDLANARAALRVEQGQQAVAERELALVGSAVSDQERDLASRGPQLEQARAAVRSAENAVEQARLDLERTTVRAPFAGIVTERSASVGDVIATSETLATLAATDVYWANVSMPVDRLRFIHAREAKSADAGSTARIYYPEAWGDEAFIDAEVLRIQPGLETSGRMARVLLAVHDPLGDDAPAGTRLLLGAYIRAAITADLPDDAIVIDSSHLHEQDRVWVLRADDTLGIRQVEVAYRDDRRAVVTAGLTVGDAVISSDLAAPVEGMPLRVDNPAALESMPEHDGDELAAPADRRAALRLVGPPPRTATALDRSGIVADQRAGEPPS